MGRDDPISDALRKSAKLGAVSFSSHINHCLIALTYRTARLGRGDTNRCLHSHRCRRRRRRRHRRRRRCRRHRHHRHFHRQSENIP